MRKVIVELDKLGHIAGVLLRGDPALWPTEGRAGPGNPHSGLSEVSA